MYSLIIPCAGSGTRFGLSHNKLFYKLNEKDNIITKTVNQFLAFQAFSEIILVVKKTELLTFKTLFKDVDKRIKFVVGGNTRSASVYNGIRQASNEIVFIHDGARCNISKQLIQKCLDTITSNQARAYSCAIACIDSIHYVENGEIVKNCNRNNYYLMQTPQIFYKQDLLKGFKNHLDDTDEVGMCLKMGIKVKIITGESENFKLTLKGDIKRL